MDIVSGEPLFASSGKFENETIVAAGNKGHGHTHQSTRQQISANVRLESLFSSKPFRRARHNKLCDLGQRHGPLPSRERQQPTSATTTISGRSANLWRRRERLWCCPRLRELAPRSRLLLRISIHPGLLALHCDARRSGSARPTWRRRVLPPAYVPMNQSHLSGSLFYLSLSSKRQATFPARHPLRSVSRTFRASSWRW